jgi:hypothetical protein
MLYRDNLDSPTSNKGGVLAHKRNSERRGKTLLNSLEKLSTTSEWVYIQLGLVITG